MVLVIWPVSEPPNGRMWSTPTFPQNEDLKVRRAGSESLVPQQSLSHRPGFSDSGSRPRAGAEPLLVELVSLLILIALLAFRFFVVFTRAACVHFRAKNVCPNARSMGLSA